MEDFESLLTQVQACTMCEKHLPLGPRPVVRLSPTVKILLISQAPGTRVHATGLPFNDPSGDRLRTWLNLTRDEFYDTSKIGFMPMGFCYPGRGKGGDNPPRPECAPLWHHKLLAHLPQVKLTLLIGSYAIANYLPEQKGKTLTQIVREATLPETLSSCNPVTLPLVHPSPRNQRWFRNNPWFEAETLPKIRHLLHAALTI
jgi:uracil-DNA glycosylase